MQRYSNPVRRQSRPLHIGPQGEFRLDETGARFRLVRFFLVLNFP